MISRNSSILIGSNLVGGMIRILTWYRQGNIVGNPHNNINSFGFNMYKFTLDLDDLSV